MSDEINLEELTQVVLTLRDETIELALTSGAARAFLSKLNARLEADYKGLIQCGEYFVRVQDLDYVTVCDMEGRPLKGIYFLSTLNTENAKVGPAYTFTHVPTINPSQFHKMCNNGSLGVSIGSSTGSATGPQDNGEAG